MVRNHTQVKDKFIHRLGQLLVMVRRYYTEADIKDMFESTLHEELYGKPKQSKGGL